MGVTLYFQDEARVAHSIFMWLGICLCFTIGILSTRTITKKAFVPVKGSAFWKLEEKFKPHCFHVTFQVIGFVFVVLGAGMAYYQTEGRQEHLETYHSKAGALTIIVIILQFFFALCRPQKYRTKLPGEDIMTKTCCRKAWEFCHHFFGSFIIIGAMLNIMWQMRKLGSPTSLQVLHTGWFLFWLLFEVFFYVHYYCCREDHDDILKENLDQKVERECEVEKALGTNYHQHVADQVALTSRTHNNHDDDGRKSHEVSELTMSDVSLKENYSHEEKKVLNRKIKQKVYLKQLAKDAELNRDLAKGNTEQILKSEKHMMALLYKHTPAGKAKRLKRLKK